MPEEINRRVTDELADPLFVTAPEGVENLAAEGITGERVVFVGNPMIDTLLAPPRPARARRPSVARLGLDGRYAVATLHRPANVDTPGRGRERSSPRSPRRRSGCRSSCRCIRADARRSGRRASVTCRTSAVIDPLGYLDFLSLVRGAAAVITDSGGIQEETTVLDVPCLTLRPNTERPITLTAGTNRLVPPAELGPALDAALAGGAAPPR